MGWKPCQKVQQCLAGESPWGKVEGTDGQEKSEQAEPGAQMLYSVQFLLRAQKLCSEALYACRTV